MRGTNVRSVGGVRVDLAPADRVSSLTRAVGIEILRVRQLVNSTARGGCGIDGAIIAHVTAAAVGLDIEVIDSGGVQVADRIRIGGSVFDRTAAVREAGGTVFNHPGTGRAVFRPS